MTCCPQLGAAAETAGQAISAGGTAATAVLPAITTAAWAVPVVGAGVAAAMLAISLISRRGRRKEAATRIVNDLEPILKQNLDGFLAGPRTAESKAQALQNFDDAIAWLAGPDACGNEELGAAGRACIQDRQRGAQWDWFAYYRDPIEQTPVESSLVSLLPAAGAGELVSSIWLPATLIVAGLLIGGTFR